LGTPSLAREKVGCPRNPKLVKWYYDKTITERAVEYYEKRCVATEMNLRGAKFLLPYPHCGRIPGISTARHRGIVDSLLCD